MRSLVRVVVLAAETLYAKGLVSLPSASGAGDDGAELERLAPQPPVERVFAVEIGAKDTQSLERAQRLAREDDDPEASYVLGDLV